MKVRCRDRVSEWVNFSSTYKEKVLELLKFTEARRCFVVRTSPRHSHEDGFHERDLPQKCNFTCQIRSSTWQFNNREFPAISLIRIVFVPEASCSSRIVNAILITSFSVVLSPCLLFTLYLICHSLFIIEKRWIEYIGGHGRFNLVVMNWKLFVNKDIPLFMLNKLKPVIHWNSSRCLNRRDEVVTRDIARMRRMRKTFGKGITKGYFANIVIVNAHPSLFYSLFYIALLLSTKCSSPID